jgi:16S rRNA processing protein RimM
VLRAHAVASRPSLTSPTTEERSGAGSAAELEVGRIVKPHGLTGEVVVELWTNVDGRVAPGVSLLTDRGPLSVEAARPHQDRYLVRFAGVEDRAGAEDLRGLVLRARPVHIEGAIWVHELVGAEVVAEDGRTLGRVVGVEANPASDLLVLDDGMLVPLRFVTALEPGRRATVDVPEGLGE